MSAARRLAWVIAALALGAENVSAQTVAAPSEGALEAIVVTATRREERLQDVAVSATAFTQQMLDAQGLRNIDDLSRLTPGVTFQRDGTGTSANFISRPRTKRAQ